MNENSAGGGHGGTKERRRVARRTEASDIRSRDDTLVFEYREPDVEIEHGGISFVQISSASM